MNYKCPTRYTMSVSTRISVPRANQFHTSKIATPKIQLNRNLKYVCFKYFISFTYILPKPITEKFHTNLSLR